MVLQVVGTFIAFRAGNRKCAQCCGAIASRKRRYRVGCLDCLDSRAVVLAAQKIMEDARARHNEIIGAIKTLQHEHNALKDQHQKVCPRSRLMEPFFCVLFQTESELRAVRQQLNESQRYTRTLVSENDTLRKVRATRVVKLFVVDIQECQKFLGRPSSDADNVDRRMVVSRAAIPQNKLSRSAHR